MRKALVLAMALVVVGLLAGPALAFQCPLLLKQIDDGVRSRAVVYGEVADPIAAQASELAAQAMKAHEGGNHAEAMVKMKQAGGLMWGSAAGLEIK